ncbi:MAG: tetratricopeptide repeat protein [Nitrospiraceae bacterium]|nr:tetratricopeptide repeat protein [Nitrospiraceae bacterium]
MNSRWLVAAAVVLSMGCATQQKEQAVTLHAPAGTTAAVSQQLEQGNGLFKQQDWQGAKAVYEATIKAEPSLAEAHYNLALTLERLGDKAAARAQYIQAANLAPGNKVIWDAPPLRKHETTLGLEKKSFMDANPR